MFCDRRIGGKEQWYLHPPADARMLIPDIVRDCVVYLGTYKAGRPLRPQYWGTGFLVSIDQRGDQFQYLVTARHIAEPRLMGRPSFMRMNGRDRAARLVNLDPDT